MNTHDIDIELPPLPSPFGIVDPDGSEGMIHYTIRDLQNYAKAYARTAIEAYRKRIADTLDALSRDANGMYEQEMDARLLGLSDGYDYAAQVVLGNTRDGEADRKHRGDPVMYQVRTRPAWSEYWFRWEECTLEQAEGYRRNPIVHDWHYEVRELFTDPQPAEPVNLCDCERSHNGLGMGGRECDCPAGQSQQPAEPCDHSYHYFGDYPIRRCNKCKELEQQPAEPARGEPVAWHYRVRTMPDGDWNEWREGRAPKLRGDSYAVQECALYAAPQPAEPVKMPSDDELKALAMSVKAPGPEGFILRYARALLNKYGAK